MATNERPVPDWMKMPPPLQHQFFKHAADEAAKCKEILRERAKRVQALKQKITTKPVLSTDEWKDWRVAVVDGSNSPTTSERLGSRFGAYCAGFMIFEGTQQVDEGYRSESFSQDQIGSLEVSQAILSMVRFNLEREIALDCLENKDVDLVLLDGSFFGFRAEAHLIDKEAVPVEGFEKGRDITASVADKTLKLLKSRKAVGIIKRTRANALDGWLLRRSGSEDLCVGSNDKHILSMILPQGHWFAYEWLFDRPESYVYYSRFRAVYRYTTQQNKRGESLDEIWEATKRNVHRSIKKALGYGGETILRTARYYLKCSQGAPFEFEARSDVDAEPLASYFLNFHNSATGLPWPIDLVDFSASLPQGFTREFVEEIEAQLIKDPEVADKIGLQTYFSYLNPQKPED